MTEDEAVALTRAYIESLFPRTCPTCGRQFDTLRDYLQNTTHLDSPVVYDSLEQGVPGDPLGPMSMANCRCGTTITVSALEMPYPLLMKLMWWALKETQRRQISMRDLLRHIRDRIDEQTLKEP
jgi:hypothetical protein